MTQKSMFIAIGGILLLAFVMATLIYKNYQSSLPGVPGVRDQAVYERQGAPLKGPADAKVTIVEFFDPACETCADFYPLVKQLMDRYPGKVRTMMRYAPLHTGSDQVVRMLEAAHLQGQFFPALELLFSNQRRWVVNHTSQPDRALGILKGMALDHDKLQADMNGPAVIQAVTEDVQAANTLGVRATPEFFVNGRPLPEWGYEQLERLVERTVKENY